MILKELLMTKTQNVSNGNQKKQISHITLVTIIFIVVALAAIVINMNHDPGEGNYGIYSLLPVFAVISCALYTKRTTESLFIGVLLGVAMSASPANYIPEVGDLFLKVFTNDTVAWIFVACGLMGSMIALITKSGGSKAFGDYLSSKIKTKKKTLFATMTLGLLIFIDDYLNAMTLGSSMKKATDKVKTSREMLSYIIDSTAAPVCIILPFSTWAVFFSGLLEEHGLAEKSEGLTLFIQAIPFMIYAWVSLIVVNLVIAGIIPPLGKMKDAEERVMRTGQVRPDEPHQVFEDDGADIKSGKMINFFVPIFSLVFFTWYFDINILYGALASIFITIALYFVQNVMTVPSMFDDVLKGFLDMIPPLGTLFCGFMLSNVNDTLGTTQYVINISSGLMTASLLPAIVFLVMASLAFATASFWGVFVIGMPIIVPLALSTGANIPLVVGAFVSASALGSHACFYGDSTVLSAKACDISPMTHALSQLPYALIGAATSTIIFIILGYTVSP